MRVPRIGLLSLACLVLLVACSDIAGWAVDDGGADATIAHDGSTALSDALASEDAGAHHDAAGPACTGANCAGCCVNDTCQDGTADSACGIGVSKCQACGAPDSCLPSRECGLAPDKLWTLTVVDAYITACLDIVCVTPDAYLTLNGIPWSSTIHSFYPAWNLRSTVATRDLLAGVDLLEVWDQGVVSGDTLLAGPAYLRFTEIDLRSGSVRWSGWGGVGYIDFTFQPL